MNNENFGANESNRFEWPVTISLPKSYELPDNQTKHYPVVYLLDGQILEGITLGVLNYLAVSNPALEVIVVAIASEHRCRDFTPIQSDLQSNVADDNLSEALFAGSGGADQLLAFLTQTLIPYVDKHYRTQGPRTLIGYSLSGLCALYTLFKYKGFFQQCVAIDPSLWWHREYLLDYIQRDMAAHSGHSAEEGDAASLYLCASNTPDLAAFQMQENAQRLQARLQHSALIQSSTFETFPEADHNTIVVPALYQGLQRLWQLGAKPAGK